jgi:hypothetical protein
MSRRTLISLLLLMTCCGVVAFAATLPATTNMLWQGYPGNRLSPDDQRRFDSYYSRWRDYKRTNNFGEVRSMEKRMYEIYNRYRIPASTPFERVATNGRPPGVYPPPPGPGRPPGPFPGWGNGPRPRQGACFYQNPNFGGQYFCLRAGGGHPNLPPGFNDRISSIRLFGGSRVAIFNDTNYRGVSAQTRHDIRDLRNWRLPTDPRRTWNDRVSSIRVR